MNWHIDDGEHTTPAQTTRAGDRVQCRIGKRSHTATLVDSTATTLTCHISGHHVTHADVRWIGDRCQLIIDHVPYTFFVRGSRFGVQHQTSHIAHRTSEQHRLRSCEVRAPMPARVVDVRVAPGDRVAKDAPVIVLEAMKMQNELLAPTAGIIRTVHVTAGQTVESNQILVTFAAEC